MISIFYEISLTSSNRMANGQRSPIFRPSGALEAILLSSRAVLPIKSSSVLSPPPLQKSPIQKPLKGPLSPQPPILTWQMSLLPTTLEMRLPEMRPHPLALPPPNWEVMTPQTPQNIPTHPPPPSIKPKATHVSSQRGSGTGGPYTGSCAFLNF